MEKQDRRTDKNRRTGTDYRKFNDPNYKGPERRVGIDRRANNDRRKP